MPPPNDTPPLITCIMPTYNRRAFVPQAIDYFLRQHHANKELIIVHDGIDQISHLVPPDEPIRHIRLSEKTAVDTNHSPLDIYQPSCYASHEASILCFTYPTHLYTPPGRPS